MTVHQFGYTEEMLRTRLIEGMKEKQESHELAHTKKDINVIKNTENLDKIKAVDEATVHKTND